jgi:hypothetical protein
MTASRYERKSIPECSKTNILYFVMKDINERLSRLCTRIEPGEIPVLTEIVRRLWKLYHSNSTTFYSLMSELNISDLESLENWEMLDSVLGNLIDDSTFGFRFTNKVAEEIKSDCIHLSDFKLCYIHTDYSPLILRADDWIPLLDWYIRYARGEFLYHKKTRGIIRGPTAKLSVIDVEKWNLYPACFKTAYDYWQDLSRRKQNEP